LNIKTLAEGVENEEQFRILRLLMCDYVQGYYLSKPVPVESLIYHNEDCSLFSLIQPDGN